MRLLAISAMLLFVSGCVKKIVMKSCDCATECKQEAPRKVGSKKVRGLL